MVRLLLSSGGANEIPAEDAFLEDWAIDGLGDLRDVEADDGIQTVNRDRTFHGPHNGARRGDVLLLRRPSLTAIGHDQDGNPNVRKSGLRQSIPLTNRLLQLLQSAGHPGVKRRVRDSDTLEFNRCDCCRLGDRHQNRIRVAEEFVLKLKIAGLYPEICLAGPRCLGRESNVRGEPLRLDAFHQAELSI